MHLSKRFGKIGDINDKYIAANCGNIEAIEKFQVYFSIICGIIKVIGTADAVATRRLFYNNHPASGRVIIFFACLRLLWTQSRRLASE